MVRVLQVTGILVKLLLVVPVPTPLSNPTVWEVTVTLAARLSRVETLILALLLAMAIWVEGPRATKCLVARRVTGSMALSFPTCRVRTLAAVVVRVRSRSNPSAPTKYTA